MPFDFKLGRSYTRPLTKIGKIAIVETIPPSYPPAMNRAFAILGLLLAGLALGCTNRPLANGLDCLFPSKLKVRPDTPSGDELYKPLDKDRDPLPPVRDLPGGSGTFRRDDLPKLGEPYQPDGEPIRRNEAPWKKESTPPRGRGEGMILPDGGK